MKRPKRGQRENWYQRCHVSRRTKLYFLGRKMSRKKLRTRLATVVITGWGNEKDMSDVFCPKCGCEATRYSGNMASYPELWEYGRCARCGHLVEMADNSPWIHALECKENGYEIVI